jgi:membrane protein implicated in regulation of membrane protease activity
MLCALDREGVRMAFELLYWHWLVLGIGLVALEIFLPSFTVIWFGLGAIMVGVLVWLFPGCSLGLQLLAWTLASIGFTIAWFTFFKPKMIDRTKAGISREGAIGEMGRVIKVPVDGGRGVVRFTQPVLGEDEWDFICDGKLDIGDRVVIRDFSGNTLIVSKQA